MISYRSLLLSTIVLNDNEYKIYLQGTYYTKVITLKCSRHMMALHCKFCPECHLRAFNSQKWLMGMSPGPLAYYV